jgi:hypothetical protein
MAKLKTCPHCGEHAHTLECKPMLYDEIGRLKADAGGPGRGVTMRVLVACEFSGTVRDAFRRRGHDAMSCDLLPTEVPGPHYQGDVRDVLSDGWDLMIAHPPCTYLAVSGMHWTRRGLRDPQLTEDALAFVRLLLDAPVPRICVENPVSVISSRIRRPDQIIQPWQFGHAESKTTCLWLKNLPRLKPTDVLNRAAWIKCPCCDEFLCTIHQQHAFECPCPPIEEWKKDPYTYGGRWANQTASGQNRLGPSPTRWAERSKTYQGIADAMADQWGWEEA